MKYCINFDIFFLEISALVEASKSSKDSNSPPGRKRKSNKSHSKSKGKKRART